jgi:hypothetical protein
VFAYKTDIVLLPIHSSWIFLNSNEPLYIQSIQIIFFLLSRCLCTLNPLKSNALDLKLTLLLSKMTLHPQSTQVRSFSTQMSPPFKCAFAPLNQTIYNCYVHFILKSLKLKPSQLKCAYAPSNHSNQIFFKSNVPLYPQTTQIKYSSTQKCLCTLKSLKSGPLSIQYVFPPSCMSLQSSIFLTQMCLCTLKSITLGPLQLKCP